VQVVDKALGLAAGHVARAQAKSQRGGDGNGA
jgi:hypothetical protein